MSNKFEQVPVDQDTKIIYQHEGKLGDYDVLHQVWSWDGVTAESLIFSDQDVSMLNDDELETEVRKSPILKQGSSITVTRSRSGFSFANFNFET